MDYITIEEHQSNYPNPITISKGVKLKVGDKHIGPDGCGNWVFCYALDNDTKGWVPEQFLAIEDGYGIVSEDYTAKELNIERDEVVKGIRELNGWVWCIKITDKDEGWLPIEKLKSCQRGINS